MDLKRLKDKLLGNSTSAFGRIDDKLVDASQNFADPTSRMSFGKRILGAVASAVEQNTLSRMGVVGRIIQNQRQGLTFRSALGHNISDIAFGALSSHLGQMGTLGLAVQAAILKVPQVSDKKLTPTQISDDLGRALQEVDLKLVTNVNVLRTELNAGLKQLGTKVNDNADKIQKLDRDLNTLSMRQRKFDEVLNKNKLIGSQFNAANDDTPMMPSPDPGQGGLAADYEYIHNRDYLKMMRKHAPNMLSRVAGRAAMRSATAAGRGMGAMGRLAMASPYGRAAAIGTGAALGVGALGYLAYRMLFGSARADELPRVDDHVSNHKGKGDISEVNVVDYNVYASHNMTFEAKNDLILKATRIVLDSPNIVIKGTVSGLDEESNSTFKTKRAERLSKGQQSNKQADIPGSTDQPWYSQFWDKLWGNTGYSGRSGGGRRVADAAKREIARNETDKRGSISTNEAVPKINEAPGTNIPLNIPDAVRSEDSLNRPGIFPGTAKTNNGLDDIPKNVLGFIRSIGVRESNFRESEASSNSLNQPHKNKNVGDAVRNGMSVEDARAKYGDYGFYQTNQSDVDHAISLGVPPEIARALNNGGGKGGYTVEQQTRAMHEYLQRLNPNAYEEVKKGNFQAGFEAFKGKWPSLPGGRSYRSGNDENADKALRGEVLPGMYSENNKNEPGTDPSAQRLRVNPESSGVSGTSIDNMPKDASKVYEDNKDRSDMGASKMDGVNPRLVESIQQGAIRAFGDPNDPNTRYVVEMQGGVGERGGRSKHPSGDAVDLQIYDRESKQYIGGSKDIMENAFGNPHTYRHYEVLGQAQYQYLYEKYGPEVANQFSHGGRFWAGGYSESRYGSKVDNMHYSFGESQSRGRIYNPATDDVQAWLKKYGAMPSEGMGDDILKWKSPFLPKPSNAPIPSPTKSNDDLLREQYERETGKKSFVRSFTGKEAETEDFKKWKQNQDGKPALMQSIPGMVPSNNDVKETTPEPKFRNDFSGMASKFTIPDKPEDAVSKAEKYAKEKLDSASASIKDARVLAEKYYMGSIMNLPESAVNLGKYHLKNFSDARQFLQNAYNNPSKAILDVVKNRTGYDLAIAAAQLQGKITMPADKVVPKADDPGTTPSSTTEPPAPQNNTQPNSEIPSEPKEPINEPRHDPETQSAGQSSDAKGKGVGWDYDSSGP